MWLWRISMTKFLIFKFEVRFLTSTFEVEKYEFKVELRFRIFQEQSRQSGRHCFLTNQKRIARTWVTALKHLAWCGDFQSKICSCVTWFICYSLRFIIILYDIPRTAPGHMKCTLFHNAWNDVMIVFLSPSADNWSGDSGSDLVSIQNLVIPLISGRDVRYSPNLNRIQAP